MNEHEARAFFAGLLAVLEEALVEKTGPELARRLGRRVSQAEVRVYLAQKRAPERQQQQPVRPRPVGPPPRPVGPPPRPVGPPPRPSRDVVLTLAARWLVRRSITAARGTPIDWR